ncbi:MAG: helix-turn-helix transcriptional regulator [Clostridia bacterium]|nr:helix-turn-helix transcriptional regulator [Oscillospiraceae bacterium]MBR2445071.1 helix-turn-helix transcriptional regulator [Clostridia bacterium]
MNYYQRLKDLREDKEKLQSEVAEILGITQQQYSRYERGLREIPFHHVITLAQYYNISLDYLAGLIDVPRKLR